jgi:hypothetical protein
MEKQELAIKVLNHHHVESIVFGTRLLARENYTVRKEGVVRSYTRYQDVTDFTMRELYEWLGY